MTSVNTNFLVTWKTPTGGSSNSSDQDSQQLRSTYTQKHIHTKQKPVVLQNDPVLYQSVLTSWHSEVE